MPMTPKGMAAMDKKHIRLPREGLLHPEDGPSDLVDGGDVEGHGLPTTAPPSFGPNRGPGHGGEDIPSPTGDEDDVEGHRLRYGGG